LGDLAYLLVYQRALTLSLSWGLAHLRAAWIACGKGMLRLRGKLRRSLLGLMLLCAMQAGLHMQFIDAVHTALLMVAARGSMRLWWRFYVAGGWWPC
jgi:hypothetical protein